MTEKQKKKRIWEKETSKTSMHMIKSQQKKGERKYCNTKKSTR